MLLKLRWLMVKRASNIHYMGYIVLIQLYSVSLFIYGIYYLHRCYHRFHHYQCVNIHYHLYCNNYLLDLLLGLMTKANFWITYKFVSALNFWSTQRTTGVTIYSGTDVELNTRINTVIIVITTTGGMIDTVMY